MIGQIFLTVFSGVAVVVISQLILKIIIDPVVSFREVLGEISHLLLYNQAKITNANGGEELRDEIKRSSARLLAKKEAIPLFKYVRKVFGLPKESSVIEASQSLNLIGHNIIYSSKEYERSIDTVGEIIESINNIEDHLNIIVRYSGK